MTSVVAGRRRPYACAWCGATIVDSERGRRRKYCKQSCRQRAYEQRTLTEGTSIPADAMILAPDELESFRDRLFELRCAAEDLATAVAEGAGSDEVTRLCDDVVTRATQAERFR
ncbi:hypothetical protein HH308_02170 [Gordonia sp. TBRC 11910]|uniref:Uncharacterized protein n=1 Tax=Gordonia asplenii TaxID=2725283 RepID=A0A848KMW7_9ACTN|nr:hypothetical protein [Gordonia asplenii]NMO00016.1 hypothetical protein [Gordonia asplenii]